MRRTTTLTLIAALTLALVPLANAGPGGPPGARFGPGGPGGPPPGGRPFAKYLFPPDRVLSHQIELGLTNEQIETIKQALNRTHAAVLDLKTDLQRVTEQLGDTLEPARVDAEAALALAERAMALEAKIKATHLRLAIEVKNALTPEQQQKLRELRRGRRGFGPPHGSRHD